jgi:hypothetical protein
MLNYIRPSRSEEIWNEKKEKLLLQYKSLNEKDLQFETGRKYEMIEKVGEKLGKSEAEIKRIFDNI